MRLYFNEKHDLVYTRKSVRSLVTTRPTQIQQIVDAPLIYISTSLYPYGYVIKVS